MSTNNVIRFLNSKKVHFSVFELPAEKLGAEGTARYLNVPANQVFKTIVVKRSGAGKPILAIIPGDQQVDLKKLSQAVGEKKLHLPTQAEAEDLTGLQAGGISPLALINRGFQMVLDKSAFNFSTIHISGGMRGPNISLSAGDLRDLIQAKMAEITIYLAESKE